MLVERELAHHAPDRDSLVTIGVFDGVHLGHRRLLEELISRARKCDCATVAITFRQHPEDIQFSKSKLPFLTDIESRTRLLKEAGVDIVIPLTFSAELANLDARSFVELLQKYLKMRGLVIGLDFALGKGREGTKETLKHFGDTMGFTLTVVPPLTLNGETISSTAIRKAMADGNMEKVRAMTGRYFSLHGNVVTGAGRGTDIGFPTANLHVKSGQALPPDGVYAGIAHVNGNMYPAMTNIGKNPTFGGNERTIESFLLEYHGDLYGHELSVDFITKLRDEKKFGSVEELRQQVLIDVERGKDILNKLGKN